MQDEEAFATDVNAAQRNPSVSEERGQIGPSRRQLARGPAALVVIEALLLSMFCASAASLLPTTPVSFSVPLRQFRRTQRGFDARGSALVPTIPPKRSANYRASLAAIAACGTRFRCRAVDACCVACSRVCFTPPRLAAPYGLCFMAGCPACYIAPE